MLFAAICTDKPGFFEKRLATRPVHLEWLASVADKVKIAGPFQNEDGSIMNGSLFIVEGNSIEEVRALLSNDPYVVKAGLFQSVEIRRWLWTINNTGGQANIPA